MAQSNLTAMNKYPSLSSIHSMISVGYLPPGHGYIPKKVKPDKPYGPSYVTILNRTWRGPGRKCLRYALAAFCLAILFYISATLYFAHRNVQRLIVKHTEPLGALLLMVAILMTSATFYFIHRARLESNRWRAFLRFRPDGLFHVVPVNEEYSPQDPIKLKTGTYGPRAVKEIPKPRYMKKSRPGSRSAGRQRAGSMTALPEGDEVPLVRNEHMASRERLDTPQRFKAEMPEVHKPQPLRPDPGVFESLDFNSPSGPASSVHPYDPQDPSATYSRPGAPRQPPGRSSPPGPYGLPRPFAPPGSPPANAVLHPPQVEKFPAQERSPAWQACTPPDQQRKLGAERLPETSRATPQPRMVPGSAKSTPTERPPAGRPQPRQPAGRLQPPQERMVPGQGKQPAGVRMTPGSQRNDHPGKARGSPF